MTRPVQLAFYQHRDRKAPLAVVRYTMFDIDDTVVGVEQIQYKDSKKGWEDFEDHVVSALESQVDVAVLTPHNVKDFQNLDGYLESIGYYLSSDM